MTFKGLLQCLMLKDLFQNDLWKIATVSDINEFITEWLVMKDYYSDYQWRIYHRLRFVYFLWFKLETDLICKYRKAFSPLKLQVFDISFIYG